VRFYSAEALAYLDKTEAAEPLGQIAREEPAFRVYALAALSAMDDVGAYDELQKLLHEPSAETRYGAFRALTQMNPNDAVVRGEKLGNEFRYHLLDTRGPDMIHATFSKQPEIVLFGLGQRFQPPMMLEAGKHIMINAAATGPVTISRFAVGEPDQKRQVSADVDEIIRTIVELGGTYPDVVQALQQAASSGALPSRFEVDAVPETGRLYEDFDEADSSGAGESAASGPLGRLLNPFGRDRQATE